MAWKTSIVYFQKSLKSYPAVGTESKTVQEPVEKTLPRIINGVETGETYTVTTTEEKEYIRSIVTTTVVEVWESEGYLEEATAKAGASSNGSIELTSGVVRQTEVEAAQSGPAGAWKCTKTVTVTTPVRGAWTLVVQED